MLLLRCAALLYATWCDSQRGGLASNLMKRIATRCDSQNVVIDRVLPSCLSHNVGNAHALILPLRCAGTHGTSRLMLTSRA
jgi:hypothetical protein